LSKWGKPYQVWCIFQIFPFTFHLVSSAKLQAAESSSSEWLTVGEAYQVAAARGLDKSDVTFRRWLKNAIAAGAMPEELRSIGLVADFDSRHGANPNNNLVRWRRFEE
jgi:hypothetical protein